MINIRSLSTESVQVVKERAESSATKVESNSQEKNKGALYVVWAMEIVIATIVVFIGILICCFCKYIPTEADENGKPISTISEDVFTEYSIQPESRVEEIQ